MAEITTDAGKRMLAEIIEDHELGPEDIAAIEAEAREGVVRPFATVEEYEAWFRDADARVAAARAALLAELKRDVAALRYSKPLVEPCSIQMWERNEETVAYLLDLITAKEVKP